MNDWKKVAVGISSLCILSGSVFFAALILEERKQREQPLGSVSFEEIAFDESHLEARAVIVYDPTEKRTLFEKNSEMQLPLASLTKLITAYAVLSARGRDQLVVIEQEHLQEEGDAHLKSGDVWRLADLVSFGLTTSSNDAMAAVASAISKESVTARMNTEAKRLHLSQSYFLNETGLDISSSTAGAYGSARDMATLVLDILRTYPDIFEATAYEPRSQAGSGEGAQSTLTPLWEIPGLIGAKTGFTDLAGGNLIAAVDVGLGEPVIFVVLGSSREGRFSDIKQLVSAVRDMRAQALSQI